MKIKVGAETAQLWSEYLEARMAKSKWTAQEKHLKGQILTLLGVDGDEKPPSMDVVDNSTGAPLGQVRVGERRGLDVKYLREKYPDVYAECERLTYSISIKDGE